MEGLTSLVTDLCKDRVCAEEVENLAKRFHVDISSKPFSQRKRAVLREILVHINRDDSAAPEYRRLLVETEQWLSCKKKSGYFCSYVGCMFKARKHKLYLKHLENVHFMDQNLICNYQQKCKQRFRDIFGLKDHVEKMHKVTSSTGSSSSRSTNTSSQVCERNDSHGVAKRKHNTTVTLPLHCKCELITCGNQLFPNLKKFMAHVSKFHHLETRICIFKNCSKAFPAEFESRFHFYRDHTTVGKTELRDELLITPCPVISNNPDSVNVGPEDEETNSMVVEDYDDTLVDEEDDGLSEEEYNSTDYLIDITKMYADFFNRLAFQHMVPQTTIDLIVSEYLSILKRSINMLKKAVEEVLVQENIRSSIRNKVMVMVERDEGIKALQQLNTSHKRESYILNNFPIVPPQEIILNSEEVKKGAKKESYQYIPLVKSMSLFLEDQTVIEILEESRNRQVESKQDIYEDVKDGWLYKSLPYFQQNPDAFVGLIYSDGIEVVNPLGAGKGRFKLLELYWTLADIPKKYRSKVDSIQLGIVVQEKLLRKYGYAQIYKPLIEDMMKLEHGIELQIPYKRTVKVGFMLHIGDNLESHYLGGFSPSFSSRDICRVCHLQYNQLQSQIHDCTENGPNSYWSKDEYDRIVDVLFPHQTTEEITIENLENHLFDEVEEPVQSIISNSMEEDFNEEQEDAVSDDVGDLRSFGLKARCPFTVLATFHPVDSFPMDFLHDFCEGELYFSTKFN